MQWLREMTLIEWFFVFVILGIIFAATSQHRGRISFTQDCNDQGGVAMTCTYPYQCIHGQSIIQVPTQRTR